ncbi:MAG: CRISPR-associated endoribonuclease Cas6 [Clostridia bacterium]|nr:MAG: CRISPR-associated endoribonuclease Cas6 [Clostridia bacterium]
MRLILTLTASGEIGLPIQHNHLLQAAVYDLIEQPGLREFLHQHGFVLGKRRFRLFAFSRLLGRVRVDTAGQQMFFTSPVNLVICSPLTALLQELGNSLLRRGEIRLGNNHLEVEQVGVDDYQVRGRSLTVRMLSPLVTYSTLENNGSRYTYYYSPFEPRFSTLISANLAKKYTIIHGRPAPEEDVRIMPVAVGKRDMKVVQYKGTVIKGWMGTYRLQGDPELLQVALDAGLGSKNSQGFGCCEVVEQPPAAL